MSKISGLGVRLYSHGYDLSGNANAIGGINQSQELQDVTTLQDSAAARQAGRVDGSIAVNAWFDASDLVTPDKLGELQALTASGALRTTDIAVMVPMGTAVGDPAAMLVAKTSKHDVHRAPGNATAAAFEYQANDYGLEWGQMLTPGKTTHASAANGASVDGGAATTAGASAQQQVFSVATGTVNGGIQDSADDVSFAAVTGLSFAGVATAGAPTGERVATAAGATIRRYVRFASSGTFTNAVLVAAFRRG